MRTSSSRWRHVNTILNKLKSKVVVEIFSRLQNTEKKNFQAQKNNNCYNSFSHLKLKLTFKSTNPLDIIKLENWYNLLFH